MNTHSTRRRKATLGLTLAAFSLVAAACGDDAGDDAAVTTDAPVVTEASDEMSEDGAFGPACSAVLTDGEGSFAGMADDPAATAASNNPVLSTLVTAVTEAGLVDTLNGEGPFTIFAPTNDAFAAIPEDDMSAVMADTDLLTSILTYHVVAGESLDAEGLAAAGELETVNGATISLGSDGTTVNDVNVVCSNVVTANATVHIIDTVLMPPAGDDMSEEMSEDAMSEEMSEDAMSEEMSEDAMSEEMSEDAMSEEMSEDAMSEEMSEEAMAMDIALVDEPSGPACSAVPTDGEGSFAGMADDPAATAASNNPVLSTLVTAVTEAGLVDTLNGEGPFTIFAPTNDAFAAIPEDDMSAVMADTDLLTSILTYHVVAGESMNSADLVEAGTVDTVNGGQLEITDVDGTLTINGETSAQCINVPTANATVHIIDAVLMPSS